MEEDIGGVWRTIGGRRVFIKEGQDLASAMKESGKFENNKIYRNKKLKNLNLDKTPLYFRFDDKNGFKGKEHESGVSMWEERIDDMISENYDIDTEKNSLLEKYNVTQEEYDNMSYKDNLKIKREIAKDEGLITEGASVFDLTEDGIDFFRAYEPTHHEMDYEEVNFFTGKPNGTGADGETVVIPEEVMFTAKSKVIEKIYDDVFYDDDIDKEKKPKEMLKKIIKLLKNE